MVDYLCRAALVTPSLHGRGGRGRGRARRYSFSDLVLLRTFARLLESGISVKRLKEAYGTWRRHFKGVEVGSPPSKFLISDGKNILLVDADQVVTELNKDAQIAFHFIVDLAKIGAEVVSDLTAQRAASR